MTILPLTTHTSPIRRLGTSTLLRNLTLAHPDPLYLLQPASSILPPILLPLISPDSESNITPEEMDLLPEECQYLTPEEHQPEKDITVLGLLLEALYLVIARGGVEAKKIADGKSVYPVVRELHLRIDDLMVKRAAEKVVDLLMVDEAETAEKDAAGSRRVTGDETVSEARRVTEVQEEEDAENEITPIF